MRHLRLFSLLLVFVLVLAPLSVLAQDDDEVELEEFTTEDELLTLGYPEGWSIEANDLAEDGVPGVMLANSDEALAAMMAEETETSLAEGQVGIAVLIFPVDILGFMGLAPAEGEELDLAATVTAYFESTMSEDDETDETELSEAEVVEFGPEGEEISAGYIEVTDADVEGAMLLFETGDGLLAMVFVGAYPGEYDEELKDTAFAIAESLVVNTTGEELMGLLMSGGTGGDTGGDTGMLDGDALVEERCTVCHSRERIDAAVKDEAGWTATVDRMISNGAELNDEERAAVLEYLVSTHGEMGGDTGMLDGDALVEERCTVCHSRERIDAADKDEAGWTATVDRMISNGAELNDEERAAVIAYLVETH